MSREEGGKCPSGVVVLIPFQCTYDYRSIAIKGVVVDEAIKLAHVLLYNQN